MLTREYNVLSAKVRCKAPVAMVMEDVMRGKVATRRECDASGVV